MSSTGRFLRTLLGGSTSQAAEVSLSTYGKLPIYKDFLRTNLAGPEAVAVKAWLDRGFSRFWEGRDTCRDHVIEPHAFLLLLPDTTHYVFGYLWGSHDAGGLRRFPFAVFGTIGAGKGSARTVAILLALGAATRDLRLIQETIQGLPSVDAFNERARRLSIKLIVSEDEATDQLLRREVGGISEAAFAASLFDSDKETSWPALRAYLARAAELDRAGTLAVRLPASDLLPVAVQAALWARLVLGQEGRRRPAMGALFPSGNPAGGVVLLDRYLRPDDVLLFNPGLVEYEFVEDLRRPGTKATGPQLPPGASGDRPLAALLG